MGNAMNQLISGMLVAGYAVIALFFLRFWTSSRDRLFIMFASAFTLLSVQRAAISISEAWMEDQSALYLIRLLAFLLILAAIVDKNRR
jgi:hypothetical protein